MAIPGMKAAVTVRGKVRCGIKGKTGSGKVIPKSVDYFVSDDPEFAKTLGEKPRRIPIHLPYVDAQEAFRTGLEQWEGKLLVCYNEGSHGEHVALRKRTMTKGGSVVNLIDGFTVVSDEVVGQDRAMVRCLDRGCPMMRAKKCKPTGRLEFFVDGLHPLDGAFQFITHSWNSIEQIDGFLALVTGDARKIQFYLCVKFEQKGQSRFPVVWMEADVYKDDNGTTVIETEKDVEVADLLLALRKAYDGHDVSAVGRAFARYLDAVMPGWRDNESLIQRVKDMGVITAAESALEKAGF